jgi:hypothetical protein
LIVKELHDEAVSVPVCIKNFQRRPETIDSLEFGGRHSREPRRVNLNI